MTCAWGWGWSGNLRSEFCTVAISMFTPSQSCSETANEWPRMSFADTLSPFQTEKSEDCDRPRSRNEILRQAAGCPSKGRPQHHVESLDAVVQESTRSIC